MNRLRRAAPNRVQCGPDGHTPASLKGPQTTNKNTIDRIVKEAADPSKPPAGATLPRGARHAGRRPHEFYDAAAVRFGGHTVVARFHGRQEESYHRIGPRQLAGSVFCEK